MDEGLRRARLGVEVLRSRWISEVDWCREELDGLDREVNEYIERAEIVWSSRLEEDAVSMVSHVYQRANGIEILCRLLRRIVENEEKIKAKEARSGWPKKIYTLRQQAKRLCITSRLIQAFLHGRAEARNASWLQERYARRRRPLIECLLFHDDDNNDTTKIKGSKDHPIFYLLKKSKFIQLPVLVAVGMYCLFDLGMAACGELSIQDGLRGSQELFFPHCDKFGSIKRLATWCWLLDLAAGANAEGVAYAALCQEALERGIAGCVLEKTQSFSSFTFLYDHAATLLAGPLCRHSPRASLAGLEGLKASVLRKVEARLSLEEPKQALEITRIYQDESSQEARVLCFKWLADRKRFADIANYALTEDAQIAAAQVLASLPPERSLGFLMKHGAYQDAVTLFSADQMQNQKAIVALRLAVAALPKADHILGLRSAFAKAYDKEIKQKALAPASIFPLAESQSDPDLGLEIGHRHQDMDIHDDDDDDQAQSASSSVSEEEKDTPMDLEETGHSIEEASEPEAAPQEPGTAQNTVIEISSSDEAKDHDYLEEEEEEEEEHGAELLAAARAGDRLEGDEEDDNMDSEEPDEDENALDERYDDVDMEEALGIESQEAAMPDEDGIFADDEEKDYGEEEEEEEEDDDDEEEEEDPPAASGEDGEHSDDDDDDDDDPSMPAQTRSSSASVHHADSANENEQDEHQDEDEYDALADDEQSAEMARAAAIDSEHTDTDDFLSIENRSPRQDVQSPSPSQNIAAQPTEDYHTPREEAAHPDSPEFIGSDTEAELDHKAARSSTEDNLEGSEQGDDLPPATGNLAVQGEIHDIQFKSPENTHEDERSVVATEDIEQNCAPDQSVSVNFPDDNLAVSTPGDIVLPLDQGDDQVDQSAIHDQDSMMREAQDATSERFGLSTEAAAEEEEVVSGGLDGTQMAANQLTLLEEPEAVVSLESTAVNGLPADNDSLMVDAQEDDEPVAEVVEPGASSEFQDLIPEDSVMVDAEGDNSAAEKDEAVAPPETEEIINLAPQDSVMVDAEGDNFAAAEKDEAVAPPETEEIINLAPQDSVMVDAEGDNSAVEKDEAVAPPETEEIINLAPQDSVMVDAEGDNFAAAEKDVAVAPPETEESPESKKEVLVENAAAEEESSAEESVSKAEEPSELFAPEEEEGSRAAMEDETPIDAVEDVVEEPSPDLSNAEDDDIDDAVPDVSAEEVANENHEDEEHAEKENVAQGDTVGGGNEKNVMTSIDDEEDNDEENDQVTDLPESHKEDENTGRSRTRRSSRRTRRSQTATEATTTTSRRSTRRHQSGASNASTATHSSTTSSLTDIDPSNILQGSRRRRVRHMEGFEYQ